MIRQEYIIDRAECDKLAEKIFLESAGINKEGAKYEHMREDAFAIKTLIEPNIKPQAAYIYFDRKEFELKENVLTLQGKEIDCPAFDKIDENEVKGLYLYGVTAGDFDFPDMPILKRLYADIWGSAYTDAVRILMKNDFKKECSISDSFGPGFYGMKVDCMRFLAQIIDIEKLGVELRKNTILVPVKSCVGMYFAVSENYVPMKNECKACMGNHRTCKLCMIDISA